MKLAEIESSSILNATLMILDLILPIFTRDHHIDDVLESGVLFGQLIFRRLESFTRKIRANTFETPHDLIDYKNVLSYIDKLIHNKNNLHIMITQNDFHFLKRSLFEETMNLLFEVKIKSLKIFGYYLWWKIWNNPKIIFYYLL